MIKKLNELNSRIQLKLLMQKIIAIIKPRISKIVFLSISFPVLEDDKECSSVKEDSSDVNFNV